MPEHRFARAPLLIYWEVTRACDLACRHCRAEAMPFRHPDELTTEEGLQLLEALRGFGEPLPHIVFTGGDPLKRPDLFEWIEAAVARGFRTAITPSGTHALTREVVHRFKASGIWMMSVSLDGSIPERHDAIRQVPGSFVQFVCGGSRARAYAVTGDPLGSDPLCVYQPPAWKERSVAA